LKSNIEQLWNEALNGSCSTEGLTLQSRQLQHEIYEHRSRSPLILDWIYVHLRDAHEQLMNVGAESLVQQALEARGKIGQVAGEHSP